MITQLTRSHKSPLLVPARRPVGACRWKRVFLVLACLQGSLLFAGCQQQDQGASSTDTAEKAVVDQPHCPVIIDCSGWHRFQDLTETVTGGKILPLSDWEDLANTTGYTTWRNSYEKPTLQADVLGYWIAHAFDALPDSTPSRKGRPSLRFIGRSFSYSFTNREAISTILTGYEQGQAACHIWDLVEEWVDRDKRPDSLRLVFLPGNDEVRTNENALLIDTGVLVAGGPAQLTRQLAALVYRSYQAIPGQNPIKVQGEAAVANTFRILANEGTAAWIEGLADTHFKLDHYSLGELNLIPEDFFRSGLSVIRFSHKQLPPLLEDPELMLAQGQAYARSVANAAALTTGGYAMATTIAENLGKDRLHQASRSVPAFVAAYQEAALANSLPLPAPGAVGRKLSESMPAFEPDVFAGIMSILAKEFPTQP